MAATAAHNAAAPRTAAPRRRFGRGALVAAVLAAVDDPLKDRVVFLQRA
jgi:hypothetical protein